MARRLALAAALLAIAAMPAFAAYPDRPIKLIVPWAAGGDTDSIYRAFAPHFQKHLGGTIVIANVGGASGTKGAKEAKDAPGDGYTVFAVHDSIHSTYYTGVADVSYGDFEPVCLVTARLVVGAVVMPTLLAAVAGLVPARRAARLVPADALRYV